MKLLTLVLSLFTAQIATAHEPVKIAADFEITSSMLRYLGGDFVEVTTIMPVNSSAHQFSLKASAAKAIQNADYIFRIGGTVLPGLEDIVAKMAPDTPVLVLADLPGARLLHRRDFDHLHHDHDEHENEFPFDSHIWMSLHNANLWADTATNMLIDHAPNQTNEFKTRLSAFKATLATLETRATALQEKSTGKRYIATHDAFQYIEDVTGLELSGMLTDVESLQIGPRELSKLKAQLKKEAVACILIEPYEARALGAQIASEFNIKAFEIDPTGAQGITPSGDYLQTLTHAFNVFEQCLTQ